MSSRHLNLVRTTEHTEPAAPTIGDQLGFYHHKETGWRTSTRCQVTLAEHPDQTITIDVVAPDGGTMTATVSVSEITVELPRPPLVAVPDQD